MWMPILDGEDGYGLTYGARVAYVGVGRRTRPAVVSADVGRAEARRRRVRPRDSSRGAAQPRRVRRRAIQREHNPGVRRRRRSQAGLGASREGARAGARRRHRGLAADVSFCGASMTSRSRRRRASRYDTRLDPVLPRNAVFARVDVTRDADGRPTRGAGRRTSPHAARRARLLGLFGQSVLSCARVREDASRAAAAVPASRCSAAGRTCAASRPARSSATRWWPARSSCGMPISSPLSVGKLGVSAFVDTGTAYEKGGRLRDQTCRPARRRRLADPRGRSASICPSPTGRRVTRVNFGAGFDVLDPRFLQVHGLDVACNQVTDSRPALKQPERQDRWLVRLC